MITRYNMLLFNKTTDYCCHWVAKFGRRTTHDTGRRRLLHKQPRIPAPYFRSRRAANQPLGALPQPVTPSPLPLYSPAINNNPRSPIRRYFRAMVAVCLEKSFLFLSETHTNTAEVEGKAGRKFRGLPHSAAARPMTLYHDRSRGGHPPITENQVQPRFPSVALRDWSTLLQHDLLRGIKTNAHGSGHVLLLKREKNSERICKSTMIFRD